MFKLHYAPKSRAMRIVWLLEELELPYELVRYELGDTQMRSATYRQINPMGRVPVLEDGDVRVNESGAIVEYVLARYGKGRLRPAVDSEDFPAYLQWLHYSEGMLMPPINTYMVETFFLPPERQSEEHAKRAKKLLGHMLRPLNAVLEDRDFLAGAFSAADIMTGHAAVSAQSIGVGMFELSDLELYLARLAERPAFQKALAA